jgi:hypothetical protein
MRPASFAVLSFRIARPAGPAKKGQIMSKTNPPARKAKLAKKDQIVKDLQTLHKLLAADSVRFPRAICHIQDYEYETFPQVSSIKQVGYAIHQAIYKLDPLVPGGVDVDEIIAPRDQLHEIARFINQDVAHLDRLPAPPAYLRRLAEWIEYLGGQPAKPADGNDDGPVEPNSFRWKRKVFRPIARGPFRALKAAWANDGHCIHKDDLAEILGDAEALLPDNTMASIRGDLNEFFTANHILVHATVRDNQLAIQDGPPRPRKSKAKRKNTPKRR